MAERIFICTVGDSPQIATETIWALINDPGQSWTPTRVEIITTLKGLNVASENLQNPNGPMRTLFRDGIPPVAIYVPRASGGMELDALGLEWAGGDVPLVRLDSLDTSEAIFDIANEFDAETMGNLIKDRVWASTRPDRVKTEVHVSIAGGRKTMSAHALLSLALVGRLQDEASHVLVSAEFENHRQFWHKDQGGLINTKAEAFNKDKALPEPTVDPASAEITLIRLPTPSVPELDTSREALGALRLSDITRQLDQAKNFRRAPSLRLNTSSNAVTICGTTKHFDPGAFVQLRLLAVAMKEGWTCDEDRDSHRAGMVTVRRLKAAKSLEYQPVDDLIRFMKVAYETAGKLHDGGQRLNPNAMKGAIGARKLSDLLDAYRVKSKARPAVSSREMNAASVKIEEACIEQLKSLTALKAALAGEFGEPLLRLMLDLQNKRTIKTTKKEDGKEMKVRLSRAMGLNCQGGAIEIE